jgi:large repetitive protein
MSFVCRVVWVVLCVSACGGGGGDPASPPVLEDGPPSVSSSGETTVTFNAPGADRFECKLDDAPAIACTSPYSFTVGDGMHTLTITAFDGDQRLPNPIVITWLVDTTPPDTSITTSPAAIDNSTTTTFEFAGVPASDTDGFECSLDGAAFAACTSPHPVATTTGAHTFAVRAHDAAGNIDGTPAQHTWTIDTAMLDTTITSGPAPSAATQGAVTFTFTASESGATFECQLDALAYAPCSTPAQFTNLTEASHTFAVRAKKGAAVDPTPAMRTWSVDLTAPPVSIVSTPPAQSNDPSPTFAFTSTEAGTTFECQIDGLYPYAPCTSPWTSMNVNQAAQTFRVRATDPAGNTGSATYSWNVDLTPPPSVTITSGPNSGTNPQAMFTFTMQGDAVLAECQIDGVVAYTPCLGGFTYTVPGGLQTFRVRAVDAAGNTSVPALWSWSVTRSHRDDRRHTAGARQSGERHVRLHDHRQRCHDRLQYGRRCIRRVHLTCDVQRARRGKPHIRRARARRGEQRVHRCVHVQHR